MCSCCRVQCSCSLTPCSCVATVLFGHLPPSALREAVEDYARHKSDTATNSTEVEVLRDGTFRTVTCAQLRVGDIVKVRNGAVRMQCHHCCAKLSTPQAPCVDAPLSLSASLSLSSQEFPADIILISSSNEAGVCYDMTANLDGETNLKLHRVPEPTRKYVCCVSRSHLITALCQPDSPPLCLSFFLDQMCVRRSTVELGCCVPL